MFSLLCRHVRIPAIAPEPEEDSGHVEGAKAGGTTCALQRAQHSAAGRVLEGDRAAQRALLGVVLLGTAMMFCDGVLSPVASGEWGLLLPGRWPGVGVSHATAGGL